MLLHKRLCHFRALSRKSRPHTASAATNSTQFNVTMTSLRLRPRPIIKREILWFRQNLYQSLYIAIKNYTSFLRYHLFLIFLSPHYHSCLMPLVVMGKDNYALPFSLVTYRVSAPRMATRHRATNDARYRPRAPSSSRLCLLPVPHTYPHCLVAGPV